MPDIHAQQPPSPDEPSKDGLGLTSPGANISLPRDWRHFNHLLNLVHLQNTYFVIRHGQALSNVTGIIVTDPKIGTVSYGLTPIGTHQVEKSVITAAKTFPQLTKDTIIISSDFLRTRETAEVARSALGAAPINLDIRLRERFFGELEGKLFTNYSGVWVKDREDPFNDKFGVESPATLLARTTALIIDLEKAHTGKTFLLVSHGDPSLILQAGFQKIDPGTYISLGRFANGEVRLLELKTSP